MATKRTIMCQAMLAALVFVSGCARQPAKEAERSSMPSAAPPPPPTEKTKSTKSADATQVAEAKPRPETLPEDFDPLQARAHLPLRERMVDLQFVSVKELEK